MFIWSDKNKNKNENEGITLIALVVTIIVLLILAGISISIVIGNNGLISRTAQYRDENNHSTVYEAIQMKAQEYYMDQAMETASESLIAYLQEQGVIDSNNKVNVEVLVGSKLSTGNGSGTSDIYKIISESELETGNIEKETKIASTEPIKIAETEESRYYLVYYDKDEVIRKIGLLDDPKE